MTKHNRLAVLTAMKQVGVTPVFYNANFEVAKNVVTAFADGGAKVVEFTNRGDRATNTFTKLAELNQCIVPPRVLGN